MKNESRNFFSLSYFPTFWQKKRFFYFKINSVKSKRKKSKNIKQATSVLKERKKCLLSINKNNDLWHINSLPKRRKSKKKLVKLQEDNKINIQSKIIFNQEFDVNDQLVPFYQKSIKKTNWKYVISMHQFDHFSTLPPFHSARIISLEKNNTSPGENAI